MKTRVDITITISFSFLEMHGMVNGKNTGTALVQPPQTISCFKNSWSFNILMYVLSSSCFHGSYLKYPSSQFKNLIFTLNTDIIHDLKSFLIGL